MGRKVGLVIPATSQINNYFSVGGRTADRVGLDSLYYGTRVLSGATTGGTLKQVVAITGAGYCPFLVCFANGGAVPHTIRCQVIVDGATVFDATSGSITGTGTGNAGMNIVDALCGQTTAHYATGVPIRFNSSLEVWVTASDSGTDYVGVQIEYHLTAG